MLSRLLFLIISSISILSNDIEGHNQEAIAKQTALLEKVFEEAVRSAMRVLTNGESLENICDFQELDNRFAVECTDGILTAFILRHFYHNLIGPLAIEYFPNTVEKLRVQYCAQAKQISTRHFPRNAREIALMENLYWGSLDLSCLPQNLEKLDLNTNLLSGPIDFCWLPPRMDSINLSNNRIEQDVILYSNLPPGMSKIHLEGNSFRRVCAIRGSPLAEENLFVGISKKKVD